MVVFHLKCIESKRCSIAYEKKCKKYKIICSFCQFFYENVFEMEKFWAKVTISWDVRTT